MPRNPKSDKLQFSGVQLDVQKLGLGVSKPDANDTIMLTGTVTTAGTGAGSAGASGGAVATHVLTVEVNGTLYYIPLCNTNA